MQNLSEELTQTQIKPADQTISGKNASVIFYEKGISDGIIIMNLPPPESKLIYDGRFTVNFVQVKTEKGYSHYCKLNIPLEGTLKLIADNAMDLMESFKLQKELDHPQIAQIYRRRALHDSV